jgi:hypothetical protein
MSGTAPAIDQTVHFWVWQSGERSSECRYSLSASAAGSRPIFFWSVGLGDLIVGLFGTALLLRPEPVSRRLFVLWNLLGIADLAHVLVLGALTLVPFFTANPDLPFVNLLPLAGVPLLFSLHILGLHRPRDAMRGK